MITDRGMGSLRVAATLAHVLPGLGARVRHGRSVVMEVGPMGPAWPVAEQEPAPRRITTAAFRCSVGSAHRRRLAGEQLRFLDLPAGCDPIVDISVPPHGIGLPGGIFCVPSAGRWLWGMAAPIDASIAYRLGSTLVADALPHPGVHALGIRSDPGTEVSMVFAETCTGPGTASEIWVRDLFESLLARWTVHDLEQRLNDPVGLNRGSA